MHAATGDSEKHKEMRENKEEKMKEKEKRIGS